VNQLSSEHSSYLRSAGHQPVDWFPWGEKAFEKARREHKPILLDIGAVWCHWCHVMDSESYENPSIARLINDNFVAIKVDRDERPDLDARYQAAVSAVSGQGGWPLTAFLIPDGRVFYGGTYFPPEDRYGRPGFSTVLHALSDVFAKEQDKILKQAEQIDEAIRDGLNRPSAPHDLQEAMLETALSQIRSSFDETHGGFGSPPKFPHPGAIELLLSCHDRTGSGWMLDVVVKTLTRMALGGVYDQLGGGFHRYSTDERWVVPHFEKMLYDNAPLLRNYLHAFQATGDPFFKTVARSISTYVMEVLYDPQGGFRASQDADVSLNDDGSYFTWSLEEVRRCVDDRELEVLQLHYNIYEEGEMPNDRERNVLFVDKPVQEIAEILPLPVEKVESLVSSGKKKMAAARAARKTPFVDPALYASWNGMMISALLESSLILEDATLHDAALRSLRRILTEHRNNSLITHRASTLDDHAFLDDQVHVAAACLDAYKATASREFLTAAAEIMEATISSFWDNTGGGFTDTPAGASPNRVDVKPIQDSPTPGGNAVAVLVLFDLAILTDNPSFHHMAEQTLLHFAGHVRNHGIFAATYFRGLERLLFPPLHVVVTGTDTDEAEQLRQTAIGIHRPGALVSRASLSEIPSFITYRPAGSERATALVCSGTACAPPVHSPEDLQRAMRQFGKG